MKKQTSALLYLLIITGCLFSYLLLYPHYHPLGGLNLTYDKLQIESIAIDITQSQSIDTNGLYADAVLKCNTPLLRQTQMIHGLQQANYYISQHQPLYFWEVRWLPESSVFNRLITENTSELYSGKRDALIILLDTNGKLIGLKSDSPNQSSEGHLSKNSAYALLQNFISTYTPFQLPDSTLSTSTENNLKIVSKTEKDFTEYEFSWKGTTTQLNVPIHFYAKIFGNHLLEFKSKFKTDSAYQTSFLSNIDNYLFSTVMVLLIIVTIVIALKRWQAYEMDFKFATGIGIVGGVFFSIYLYITLYRTMGINIFFPVVVNALFTGGTLIFIWAVGETLSRETSKEKFFSLDLLRNGYFFHPQIGKSILRGIAIGSFCLLLSALLTICVDFFQQIAFIPYLNESHLALSSSNPLLRIVSIHLFGIIWFVAAYMMFGLSALKRFFSTKTAPIFIVALIVTFIHREGIEPYGTGSILEFFINFIIIWGFWRYDLLTGIMIMGTYVTWYQGGSLYSANNAFYVASAWKLSCIYAVLVMLAGRAYYSKDITTDFDQLAPKFFKNITERQRLKRELEIARQVQMSFLPNETPNFPQLEIASKCLPALEVGGDYYDFVPIGNEHLGVAIGDVSGKGTQAAFYMTLTKGFLRALANLSESPGFVLSQLNRLFYQNVKRGVFVSMIYSVFDFRINEMILARAGHNPVLLHRGRSRGLETISP